MTPNKNTHSLGHAFAVAFEGVVDLFSARNIRIQLAFAIVALALGLGFQISILEWVAIFICIGLVLGGECMNTAIEHTVDLACPEINPLAKRAKDAAAGGVLLFSIVSLVVGILIFLPRILEVVL